MSEAYDQDPQVLGALLDHVATQLDHMLAEPLPDRPLPDLYRLQADAGRLGALTTRLLQLTWQTHGELPKHFHELDPRLLGARILPARMHGQPLPNYEPAPLSVTGHRQIAGPRGAVTFDDNEFGEQRLACFNSAISYGMELPAMRMLDYHFGWNAGQVMSTVASECNHIMGRDVFRLSSKGHRGVLLWAYPGLQIVDTRE
jgi:hypothetical protein